MIKCLLQVDPKNRPATDQILHMPIFIAKYNEMRQERIKEIENDKNPEEEF